MHTNLAVYIIKKVLGKKRGPLGLLVALLGPVGASMACPRGRHEANLAHPGVFWGTLGPPRVIWADILDQLGPLWWAF